MLLELGLEFINEGMFWNFGFFTQGGLNFLGLLLMCSEAGFTKLFLDDGLGWSNFLMKLFLILISTENGDSVRTKLSREFLKNCKSSSQTSIADTARSLVQSELLKFYFL